MKKPAIFSFIFILLLLSGCGSSKAPAESTFFAMDTVMGVRIWGGTQSDCDAVASLIHSLEKDLSVTQSDRAIYKLNHTGSGTLPKDAADLLRETLALSTRTHGALDPTIYPIVQLWGFTTGDYRVPSAAEISTALETVGTNHLTLEADNSITLSSGTELDFGAVAKGYAARESIALLQSRGVDTAILSLSGNIQTLGTKPDGSDWLIDIRDPQDESVAAATLQISGTASIVTSGDYERYFEQDGVRYHHIMDPATGRPADTGLSSVTIVAQDGLLADALSTALFIMGTEQAQEFWRSSDDFEAVFITKDGALLVTEGLSDHILCDNPQVITR